MKTFKDYYAKNVLGIREIIKLSDFPDIGELKTKVDTGNEAYNVLHGVNIRNNNNQVTFTTAENKEITLPKIDTITIHIGSGVKEKRPVVELSFILKGKEYKNIPFSIADRSENEEPVLLGEPFLKQTNTVVDSKE